VYNPNGVAVICEPHGILLPCFACEAASA
jgi:hypothetical protein